jgi:hypothetical protein
VLIDEVRESIAIGQVIPSAATKDLRPGTHLVAEVR